MFAKTTGYLIGIFLRERFFFFFMGRIIGIFGFRVFFDFGLLREGGEIYFWARLLI